MESGKDRVKRKELKNQSLDRFGKYKGHRWNDQGGGIRRKVCYDAQISRVSQCGQRCLYTFGEPCSRLQNVEVVD
jgi:hypothetical protein